MKLSRSPETRWAYEAPRGTFRDASEGGGERSPWRGALSRGRSRSHSGQVSQTQKVAPVRYWGCICHCKILSFPKFSLPKFSDASFPGSLLSGSSLCPPPARRPGLLVETLLLSFHTFSQGAVTHTITAASSRGRLMTSKSPPQLRPLLSNASPVVLGSHLSGISLSPFFNFILWLIYIATGFFIYLVFGHTVQHAEILVPQPGIVPVPPALGVQSLNHWTTREVPQVSLKCLKCTMAKAELITTLPYSSASCQHPLPTHSPTYHGTRSTQWLFSPPHSPAPQIPSQPCKGPSSLPTKYFLNLSNPFYPMP